jgi:alanyl-tRNA synthetase
LKSSKLQDGIVRIEFTAGLAAEKVLQEAEASLEDVAKILNCTNKQIPGRVEELFLKWKRIMKKNSAEKFILDSSVESEDSDDKIISKAAAILNTQPENIIKTVERFLREIYEKQKSAGIE